jgi:hypothetical protein
MVADVSLGLEADAQAQREIRPHLPVVAREHARIHLMHRQVRISGADAELRRSSAQCLNLERRVA